MSPARQRPLVRRTGHVLRHNPARVISKLFLPGQEVLTPGPSRASEVIDRVLTMSDTEVNRVLAATMNSFDPRHRDLAKTFGDHFELIAHRIPDVGTLAPHRSLLIGAYFSQEYAVEGAAVLNPSMVPHPDMSGLGAGETRFVMSLRAVGEGHISSVEFRTGVVDDDDVIHFDDPGDMTVLPQVVPSNYERAVFAQQCAEFGGDQGDASFVLKALPEVFTASDLDRALAKLHTQHETREAIADTIKHFDQVAATNYSIAFPAESALHERVIHPRSQTESHGLEDVRLTRFTDGAGAEEYIGTYTAFDGLHVAPQLIRTPDFRTFRVCQLSGPAAKDKGMALFPRRVDGRFLALSRWDRESNSLAYSDDLHHWGTGTTIQTPHRPWEIVNLGNCGPPLETPDGWVMLTHGVGPMREYCIGAALLDLEDPSRLLAELGQPILTPSADERNGYVPNVVYSCGGMMHGDTLVLPYGCSDASIRVALIDMPRLLIALKDSPVR